MYSKHRKRRSSSLNGEHKRRRLAASRAQQRRSLHQTVQHDHDINNESPQQTLDPSVQHLTTTTLLPVEDNADHNESQESLTQSTPLPDALQESLIPNASGPRVIEQNLTSHIQYAARVFSPQVPEFSLGLMDVVCDFCLALRFRGEAKNCCHNGKVSLPPSLPYPTYLMPLFIANNSQSKNFFSKYQKLQ